VTKAVLFDLYETLVTHFDPDWAPPPRSIAERLGLEEAVYGEHWPPLDKAWQAGEIEHYEEALARVCEVAGREPDASVLAELTHEYRTMTTRTFEEVAPEITEMVAALKGSGLVLGVVTNASNLDAEPWPGSALAPFFDEFVASYQVGLSKPDRRIYELACHKLDARPAEAVFVGDGGSDELGGAARVGMQAYWCTWFLERWPEGIRPNGFAGDEWRQRKSHQEDTPYERLARPLDLLDAVLRGSRKLGSNAPRTCGSGGLSGEDERPHSDN
jgi:HAD superfamily hydrolase (TIGR01509 family)